MYAVHGECMGLKYGRFIWIFIRGVKEAKSSVDFDCLSPTNHFFHAFMIIYPANLVFFLSTVGF